MNTTPLQPEHREAAVATIREHQRDSHHPIGNLALALKLLHGLTVTDEQAAEMAALVHVIVGIADGSLGIEAFLNPGEPIYVTPAIFLAQKRDQADHQLDRLLSDGAACKVWCSPKHHSHCGGPICCDHLYPVKVVAL